MAVLRGTWAVLDVSAGSVTASDRHSQWQVGQEDCLQVRGVQSLDTPLDTRRCETRQESLRRRCKLFHSGEGQETHSQEGQQGTGDGHEP